MLHTALVFILHNKHPSEERYQFLTPSTMKPTQIRCSEGSVNQLPPWTEIKGKK